MQCKHAPKACLSSALGPTSHALYTCQDHDPLGRVWTQAQLALAAPACPPPPSHPSSQQLALPYYQPLVAIAPSSVWACDQPGLQPYCSPASQPHIVELTQPVFCPGTGHTPPQAGWGLCHRILILCRHLALYRKHSHQYWRKRKFYIILSYIVLKQVVYILLWQGYIQKQYTCCDLVLTQYLVQHGDACTFDHCNEQSRQNTMISQKNWKKDNRNTNIHLNSTQTLQQINQQYRRCQICKSK